MLISRFKNENIEKNIEGFEKKYQFKFPTQYREFLLKYNGGATPDSKFKINKVSSDIEGFYGLGQADKYNNYDFFERTKSMTDFIEDEVIPIAGNSFGDYVVMGIGEENQGKVYFYYHDRKKRFIELTEDFKTFVDKCKSDKIGHVPSIEERKQMMIDYGGVPEVTPERLAGWQAEIDYYSNINQEELILD